MGEGEGLALGWNMWRGGGRGDSGEEAGVV